MSVPRPRRSPGNICFLGIEGGATRSTGVLLDEDEKPLCELHGPPANIKLISEKELANVLGAFAERLPRVPLGGIGVGFAGVRTPADRERVRSGAARIWPGVPCFATNDLETALESAVSLPDSGARVLVLSGTGSCCFGVSAKGASATVGGRGHVVGDRGSACDISQQALRGVMAELDHTGKWPLLGQEILRMLCLNDVEELIAWSLQADKSAIASLATAVFYAASRRDRLAQRLLRSAALALAEDADACAAKLAVPGERIQFVLNGGVLLKNPGFSRAVGSELKRRWPGCHVTPVQRASCWGAALLAKTRLPAPAAPKPSTKTTAPRPAAPTLKIPGLEVLADSPTEKRNPRSRHLDRMPLESAVALMLEEEGGVAKALLRHRSEIVWAVRGILSAFRCGGRLFYVGAGTSGRLGILDASECPPTFRSPGEQVQGIIAGGAPAIWSAVEGAEDDTGAGTRAVAQRGIRARDFVVGIAASGRTPFVWAALAEAARRGACTFLVCFNPGVKKIRRPKKTFWPRKILAADLGPEVLTGSTRLKCGTATKLLLNLFSTLALARSGKVLENLMIDLNPSNSKLRERAVRILMQLENCGSETAREALGKSHGSIPAASKALRRAKKTKLKADS